MLITYIVVALLSMPALCVPVYIHVRYTLAFEWLGMSVLSFNMIFAAVFLVGCSSKPLDFAVSSDV